MLFVLLPQEGALLPATPVVPAAADALAVTEAAPRRMLKVGRMLLLKQLQLPPGSTSLQAGMLIAAVTDASWVQQAHFCTAYGSVQLHSVPHKPCAVRLDTL
jgi:hypothetical protein